MRNVVWSISWNQQPKRKCMCTIILPRAALKVHAQNPKGGFRWYVSFSKKFTLVPKKRGVHLCKQVENTSCGLLVWIKVLAVILRCLRASLDWLQGFLINLKIQKYLRFLHIYVTFCSWGCSTKTTLFYPELSTLKLIRILSVESNLVKK